MIISVASGKGGTGKTLVATSLALSLKDTYNVQLLDCDASDSPPSPDREAFHKICTNVGIHCHILEYRAIENYLSERAVKYVKGEKYRSLKPYEKLETLTPGWGKQENWRIAREMTREELDQTDLGEFLNNL